MGEDYYRVKIVLENRAGASNNPQASKFEVVRGVVDAMDRFDVLRIEIHKILPKTPEHTE